MTEPEFTIEELNSEVWKLIPGFNDRYEVSNLGRLRSLTYHGKTRIKILHPSPNTKGYVVAGLYEDRVCRSVSLHILVASAFCNRQRANQLQVNHKDLNKQNNRASNLEWNTAKEDGEHRARSGAAAKGSRHGAYTRPDRRPSGDRHGSRTKPHRLARGERNGMSTHPETVLRGECNPNAKLTESLVIEIRQAYAVIKDFAATARMFNISETHATRIIKRKSWKHID